MTVINPNSISGITSITLPSGSDNVLTIHTNDGVERFRIDSTGNIKVGSAATISPDGDLFVTGVTTTGGHFAGSGANLTSLPAANLTGALPALDGSALTGVASTDNIRTNTDATFLKGVNVSGVTTTGSVKVGGGVTISESGIDASGIGITVANINGTQIGGRRNLIINGAMVVAQRGTSATTSSGYQTVDRFEANQYGVAESPSQSQSDVASGTTPYTEGFRKAYKLQNGNQTQADNDAFIRFKTVLEAQDIANSGWNYVSSSSFITLSFWIKSSVAQNFYGRLQTEDGTARNYPFETGSLTANTWTKVVKTIPGNTSPTLQFDNNNGSGLILEIAAWYGTDYTGSMSLNTWATYSDRTPDFGAAMDDWYLTNDATLEITGVQLEVGPQATAFEHRSFGEELSLCQRYFYKIVADGTNKVRWFHLLNNSEHYRKLNVDFPTIMRTSCTVSNISFINSAGQSCTAQYSCEDHVTFQSAVNGNNHYAGLYGADFTAEF